MFNLEKYIDKFTNDMPCMGIMMAHIDKEPDAISGGFQNMVATLGQKLAPKIPRPFSDVILAKRNKAEFVWSTIDDGFRLKTRNFAFADNIKPTWVPLVKQWQAKIKAEEMASEASAQIADAKK